MRTTRRAFTLIELLVVIAIIEILSAIPFPVFAQPRESAEKTTCLSNGKQIGLAAAMYTNDHDEAFIPAFIRSGLPRDTARRDLNVWVHLIQPYLKNGEAPRVDYLPAGGALGPFGVFRSRRI